MIKRVLFLSSLMLSLVSLTYAQGGPPTEKELEVADGKHTGLQIDRIAVLKSLALRDTTLKFKETGKLNAMPILTAHGVYNSDVEVVGTENNLRKVTYRVFVKPADDNVYHVAWDHLGNMVATIVPRKELLNWMLKKYSSIKLFPSVEIKESYSIVGNLLTFIYDPNLSSITFSIATQYN